MAKVSAHGEVLLTYLSLKYRCLRRFMSDGTVLHRTPFGGWKVAGKEKPGRHDAYLALVEEIKRRLSTLPEWRRVESIPSDRALYRMAEDGIAETPTGHRVEPDGKGPDGSPSWLLVFGLI